MRAAAAHHESTTSGGRLIGGRYELRSVIARGGMGRVWRATDTLLGREVAVKILHSEFTDDPTFLSRFRSEARLAGLLADPNIATVHDYGESPDGESGEYLAYLVMELVDGAPLSVLLRRALGGLDTARTLSIVRQTASALAAAHAAGVVHRDVKPANILVTSSGAVKLTDFGIAWSESSTPLTRIGQVVGTAHYLAPEQVEGEKATPTSDVYSLGVVAYECLAGRRPFEGENSVQTALRHIREVPEALPPHVPDDVRALVEHAMARDPGARLRDGAALRDACDVLAAAQEEAAMQETTVRADETVLLPAAPMPDAVPDAVPDAEPVGSPSRWRRPPRPAVAAVVGAGALVLLALVLVFVAGGGPGPASNRSASRPTSAGRSAPTTGPAIRLVGEDLIGRPVTEVRARLIAAGLRVELRPTVTADVPADAVVSVDPLGAVVPGRLVTVTYATPPAPRATAPSVAGVPASTPSTPAPSSATASAATTSPGKGHGNANGSANGHGPGHGKNG